MTTATVVRGRRFGAKFCLAGVAEGISPAVVLIFLAFMRPVTLLQLGGIVVMLINGGCKGCELRVATTACAAFHEGNAEARSNDADVFACSLVYLLASCSQTLSGLGNPLRKKAVVLV